VRSCLPSVIDAIRSEGSEGSLVAGTPAGTVVVRAAGLRVHGGTVVTADDAAPWAGELAVFCRPLVTAPVLVRRTVAAGGWLPDLVFAPGFY
jgi:hypothetical protein